MSTYIESMKSDMQGMGMIGTTSTGSGIGKKMQRNAALLLLAAGFALSVAPARAEVHLPNGEYRTSHTDLRVKVLGGYVTVERTWQAVNVNKGQYRWYLNPAWADLDLVLDDADGQIIKSIGRTGAKFEKQNDDLFVLKEADHAYFIRTVRNEAGHRTGLRWTDRLGNAIDYDADGKVISYNDHNGIAVHFGRDAQGHITEVRDHNHVAPAPALLTWTWSGEKVTAISDYSGRSVQYHYTGDNLTEVIDVLQHPWGYSYVGAAATPLMHTETDAEGRVTTIDYQGNRVWKVTGPVAGATTVYEYNYDRGSRQYTAVETSPEGKHTESTYDADGKLIRQEIGTGSNIRVVSRTIKDSATVDIEYDERNQPTRTEYDANRNPIKVTYPDGSTTSATYDGAHSLPLTRTDELGVITKYEYDTNGNPTMLTEAFGLPEQRVTTYTNDPLGQRLTQTVKGETPADDATTTWTYDAYGNVQSATDAENHTTSFAYDVQGNIVKRTDARQKDWFTPTNAAGWVTSQKDPLGHETIFTYDKVGNRTVVEDPAHNITRYTYTPWDLLETVTDPLGGVKTTHYTKDGLRKEEIDESGVRMLYVYDGDGRLTSTTDGAGNLTTLNYGNDCAGQSVAGLRGANTSTWFPTYCEEYKYDQRNRRTLVTRTALENEAPLPLRSRADYDVRGDTIAETDSAGTTTLFTYDGLHRRRSSTDAGGGITTYAYDSRNNLIRVTDASTRAYVFGYDRSNRRVSESLPLGQAVVYVYDENGNRILRTSPTGSRRVYSYDEANRLIEQSDFLPTEQVAGQLVTYTYGATDLLDSYAQSGETTSAASYGYDAIGHKVSEVVTYGAGAEAFTRTIRYEYQANGLKSKLTYPDGTEQVATYDRNRLIGLNIKARAITYQDYRWFAPTKINLPGVTRSLTYDPLMRPIEIKSMPTMANALMDERYVYDAAGNVVKRGTEDGDYVYSYDNLGRVIGAIPPAALQRSAAYPDGLPVEQYTYDKVHNRKTSAHQPGPWTYDENNRILVSGVGSDRKDYSYNANGSPVAMKVGDPGDPAHVRTFKYDAEDRLAEVVDDSVTVTKYQYDPLGRRIRKVTPSGAVWFQYGDEGLVAEYGEGGVLRRAYGWKPGSTWGSEPVWLADVSGAIWQLYYFHTDYLGTPRALTDAAGNVVWRAIYEAYGNAIPLVSSINNPIRFPGQYVDETKYSYNFNRDYDAASGRYLQADPIGIAGGLNLYSYVSAQPTMLTDPEGLSAKPCNKSCCKTVTYTDKEGGTVGGRTQCCNHVAVPCTNEDVCQGLPADVCKLKIDCARAHEQFHVDHHHTNCTNVPDGPAPPGDKNRNECEAYRDEYDCLNPSKCGKNTVCPGYMRSDKIRGFNEKQRDKYCKAAGMPNK